MMAKKKAFWMLAFILIGEISSETLSFADEGSCGASVTRSTKTLIYKSDSIKETDDTVTVQSICTNEVVTIKKCAVIENLKVDAQRFCFPPNAPEYFEYANKLEFYM